MKLPAQRKSYGSLCDKVNVRLNIADLPIITENRLLTQIITRNKTDDLENPTNQFISGTSGP